MRNFLKGFFIGFGIMIFFVLGIVVTKAYELLVINNKSTIEREVEVTKTIKYDNYLANPNFNSSKELSIKEYLSNEEKNEIINTFSKILELANNSDICKGGSYTLQQNIAYKDGIQFPSGFLFKSGFECNFSKEKIKNYEELLNNFNEVLKDNKYITLDIPAVNEVISDTNFTNIKESLHDEIYEKSEELKEHYSKISNKICKVINITYENNSYPYARYKNDIIYNIPTVEKDMIAKLKANIKIECE